MFLLTRKLKTMSRNDLNSDLKQFDAMLHAAGAIITVALAVVLYLVLYAPLDRRHTHVVAHTASLDALLDRASDVRGEHAKLSESLAEIMKRSEALHRRVPQEPREVEFLTQVTEAANVEHLIIRGYHPSTIVNKQGYSQMEVTLNGEGTYYSICGFLDRIDRLPRMSSVVKMDIRSESPTIDYPIELTLVIYFNLKKVVAGGEQETHG